MGLAPERIEAPQEDLDAVRRVALEYIDSYARGDAERHERVYHSEAIKRRYARDPESGIDELIVLSPRIMAEYAGRSEIGECETEVIVDAISEDLASVRVYSCRWVDFLHVVKARGEWRLFHVTWHGRRDEG